MPTYEEMLKQAMAKIPKREGTGERFEMPMIDTNIQGGVTIMRNFAAVAAKLRREPKHMLKWLTKELAAPGNIEGDRASIQAGAGIVADSDPEKEYAETEHKMRAMMQALKVVKGD